MANICPQCGAPAQNGATTCQYCGAAIPAEAPAAAAQGAAQQNAAPSQPVIIVQSAPQQQAQPQTVYVQEDPRKSWPVKNKIVAVYLRFFSAASAYINSIWDRSEWACSAYSSAGPVFLLSSLSSRAS